MDVSRQTSVSLIFSGFRLIWAVTDQRSSDWPVTEQLHMHLSSKLIILLLNMRILQPLHTDFRSLAAFLLECIFSDAQSSTISAFLFLQDRSHDDEQAEMCSCAAQCCWIILVNRIYFPAMGNLVWTSWTAAKTQIR